MHAAASVILNVRIRWRLMVSFTPRPLCLMENDLATHRMGGWVGSRAGLSFGDERNFLPLSVFEHRLN